MGGILKGIETDLSVLCDVQCRISFNLKGFSMEWIEYEGWWTLNAADGARRARLYKPDYRPKWRAVLLGPRSDDISLDPDMTETEAKQVLQAIAGAQP